MRILIIEDNPKIAASIKSGLNEAGFAVDVAHTGFQGEELATGQPGNDPKAPPGIYDIILLDVMLADRDGLDVCRSIRRRGVKSKILMLTALSLTADKIAGLDSGADDYLTKPFEFEELLARLRALVRRGDAAESRCLRCEDLELDLYTRVAKRDGKTIPLRNKEFSLLEFLMRNPDRVLSRTLIGEKVWDMNYERNSNVVDVYVSSLRRRMDRGFGRRFINTYRGVGYSFNASNTADVPGQSA